MLPYIRTKAPMLNIAILAGGNSSERDISLKSAQEVRDHLNTQKYKISFFDFPKDIPDFLARYKDIDVVLPIFHGHGGEDGTIQGFLETLGVRYAFSGVAAHALALNKHFTKIFFENIDIPTASSIVLQKNRIIPDTIELPVVIKPVHGGSSIGISLARTAQELQKGVDEARILEDEVLIEKYVVGEEYTVAVLGNEHPEALPVVSIKPKNSFFDLEAKYDATLCAEICPAPMRKSLAQKLQDLALKAHAGLGCRGVSRTDFIVTKGNKFYVLETNTIPGLTKESLLPKAAQAAGYSFPELLDKIITLAMR